MFSILSHKDEIRNAQELFIEKFKPYRDQEVPVWLGFQGGSLKRTIYWSESLVMWFHLGDYSMEGNRYWNAFCFEKPHPHANLNIVCEINIPLEGINRMASGLFFKDSNGNVFVGHRGKIGSGRKGIGKQLFH
ncbi:hypothetical protein [Brevibacillus thermoruber]|uniref:hypothetical protein n=1 Tax=Brevibacillus thermoruber TaxID=33942 RepID=UPI00054FBDB0|nr:hypothetical protein [Brevibacillus thermoruber]